MRRKKTFNRILLEKTSFNFIPVLIPTLLWVGIVASGLKYIHEVFQYNEAYVLVVIIWIVACMSLARIIPNPITTYEEVIK